MPDADAAFFEAVSNALQQVDPGTMPVKFVLLLEVIDRDGDRALWTAAGPNMTAWDTVGMLGHAMHVQQADTTKRRIEDGG